MLKEGTDSSQGVPQLISNINACQFIADAVRTTLGPRGMDKLIVNSSGGFQFGEIIIIRSSVSFKLNLIYFHLLVVSGKATISNDGATIISLLDVVHPAAKTLVDISKSQDAEVCIFLPFVVRFDKVCHVLRCTARLVYLLSFGVLPKF